MSVLQPHVNVNQIAEGAGRRRGAQSQGTLWPACVMSWHVGILMLFNAAIKMRIKSNCQLRRFHRKHLYERNTLLWPGRRQRLDGRQALVGMLPMLTGCWLRENGNNFVKLQNLNVTCSNLMRISERLSPKQFSNISNVSNDILRARVTSVSPLCKLKQNAHSIPKKGKETRLIRDQTGALGEDS